MKQKGFTLIELLAVIVILAIIALIATPVVLNIISDSKDAATLRSAEHYLDAVEQAVVNNNMNGKEFNPTVCNVSNEKLYCDGTLLDVDIKGGKPNNNSVIVLNNGKIEKVKLIYGDKIIIENEKDILIFGEDIEILPAGLYDDNNGLVATWDELINKYDLNIEANYTAANYKLSGSMTAVLNNNPELSSGTKLIINDNITTIGNMSFRDCESLKKINIPNSVTSVGTAVFYNCKNINELILSENITTIPMNFCMHCESLKEIKLPDDVTQISSFAFNSSGLTKINIPNSVTNIMSMAFYKTKLTEIYIPKNTTSINESAFKHTKNLKTIVVDKENSVYDSRDNSNAIIETSTNKLIVGSKSTVIPNGVISLGQNAFLGNDIANINIPASVTSIHQNSFAFCENLEKITVDKDNTIYDSRDNSNAVIETSTNTLIVGSKDTVIPNTVTSIGNYAFYGSGISTINIPASVASIDIYALKSCSSLEKITVDKDNTIYDSRDNSNAIIETSTNTLIVGSKNTVIPNTVTSLGTYAFYENGVTDINIPSNIQTIGQGAFYGCSSLKQVNIQDGVVSIGDSAFVSCNSLESITIPVSVTKINTSAFALSKNLKTIYYKGTATGAPWGAPNATVINNY